MQIKLERVLLLQFKFLSIHMILTSTLSRETQKLLQVHLKGEYAAQKTIAFILRKRPRVQAGPFFHSINKSAVITEITVQTPLKAIVAQMMLSHIYYDINFEL